MSLTRSQVIARAQSWVGIGLVYNQGATHNAYRTDCSGYVSMCWGLDAPGDDTTGFVPSGEAVRITEGELKAGDALLNDDAGNLGHVVLFDHWDTLPSAYWGYEFTPSGVLHRVIPYPYFNGHGTFLPVHCANVVDGPTPAPSKAPDMPAGIEITTGDNVISFPEGSCTNVAFFCDNTLYGASEAQLRVVIWAAGSPPNVQTIYVGNVNGNQTELRFPDAAHTHTVSTRRLDSGTFPIGVEVS